MTGHGATPGPVPSTDDRTDDRWASPPVDTVDAIVIGMGPGGEEVARRLVDAGLEVVGIEAELVGGECPYWACVPSKMMVRAAGLLAEGRRVDGLAGEARVKPSWEPVAQRIRDDATSGWDDSAAADRFTDAGGRLVRGRGAIVGPRTVAVGERTFEAQRGIVIATGTVPRRPPVDGLAGTPYWTNREAIAATSVPQSLAVLGGGAVGVELAQVFRRFGAEVTIIERADQLVPAEDAPIGELLAEVFDGEGIEVLTDREVERVEHLDRFEIVLDDGRRVDAERLLVAAGRRADLGRLGLRTIGLDSDADTVPTDQDMRAADGVWAVGDVTGVGNFTHVAIHQAQIAAADILGRPHAPAVERAVPRVTFTDPEIGSVGVGEARARELGIDVGVGAARVSSTARGWLHGPGGDGLIRVVADRERDVLVGGTVMAPSGGEALGLLTLAVHAEVPLDRLRTMVLAYPTFHRGIADAIDDLDER